VKAIDERAAVISAKLNDDMGQMRSEAELTREFARGGVGERLVGKGPVFIDLVGLKVSNRAGHLARHLLRGGDRLHRDCYKIRRVTDGRHELDGTRPGTAVDRNVCDLGLRAVAIRPNVSRAEAVRLKAAETLRVLSLQGVAEPEGSRGYFRAGQPKQLRDARRGVGRALTIGLTDCREAFRRRLVDCLQAAR
jgi:hypothetical protein